MICPHCEKDTPPTLPYCQACGLSIDLSFENVQETFSEEAATRAVRGTEERARTWLLGAATALLIVLFARWMLVPKPTAPPIMPPYLVAEPVDAAGASPVAPLPLEVPPLSIPK